MSKEILFETVVCDWYNKMEKINDIKVSHINSYVFAIEQREDDLKYMQ